MKRTLIVLSTVLLATGVLSANVQNRRPRKPVVISVSLSEKEEWEKIKRRYAEYSAHISGLAWTLTHTYRSKTEMERGLEVMKSIGLAMASDHPTSVRKFNGPGGIKQRLLNLTNSKDDTVSGFAAIMLAIIGDSNHAPRIAILINRHGTAERDARAEITIRGHAATALGLLGARQYSSRIAVMLKSNNRYDREGAATALGLLKATDYAKDVAATLSNESVGFWDDDSPILSLFEMGVAADYKKEIAGVLHNEIQGDSSKTAAYALARLGAKEHAPDIALLLRKEFRRGDAAKALALLGAGDYTAEIVLIAGRQGYVQPRRWGTGVGSTRREGACPSSGKTAKRL